MAGNAAVKRDLGVIKEEQKPGLRETLTSYGASICEILQLAWVMRFQALIMGPSGIGKTVTAKRWVAKHEFDAIFFTVGITVHTYGNLIDGLAEALGSRSSSYYSLRDRLDGIVERLQERPILIILDEVQAFNTKMWETLRHIHDESGAGLVYLGQPGIIDRLRGKGGERNQLDHVVGRLAIRKLFGNAVSKEDAKIVADSLCPDLSKKALDFLAKKAQLDGKLRLVRYILEVSIEVAKTEDVPIDYRLISRVSNSLGL
jgi:DNA transposition AAA+ family ATPase